MSKTISLQSVGQGVHCGVYRVALRQADRQLRIEDGGKGTIFGSRICCLRWVAVSLMTAAMVVSLPVPARGRHCDQQHGVLPFKIPTSCSAGFPLARAAAAALAVSSTEPPPTARMASQPAALRTASLPRQRRVGAYSVKNDASIPFSLSAERVPLIVRGASCRQ